MTHEEQSTNLAQAVQLLAENGFEGMANAIEILFNEAMRLQRQEYIGAAPYERSQERRAYANGFKPKTVNSRLGKLNLQVPQTRDGQFYPNDGLGGKLFFGLGSAKVNVLSAKSGKSSSSK